MTLYTDKSTIKSEKSDHVAPTIETVVGAFNVLVKQEPPAVAGGSKSVRYEQETLHYFSYSCPQ